jgi:hypothetical protein
MSWEGVDTMGNTPETIMIYKTDCSENSIIHTEGIGCNTLPLQSIAIAPVVFA